MAFGRVGDLEDPPVLYPFGGPRPSLAAFLRHTNPAWILSCHIQLEHPSRTLGPKSFCWM